MNRVRLNLENHESGTAVTLQVYEMNLIERLKFLRASIQAACNGRACLQIAHAQTYYHGRVARLAIDKNGFQ